MALGMGEVCHIFHIFVAMKLTFLGACHEVTGSMILLEAAGKKIVIDCGMEQGKDVFAVPGDIVRSSFDGTNHLIKNGAKPVFTAEDVLSEYEYRYGDLLDLSNAKVNIASVPYVDYRKKKSTTQSKDISKKETEVKIAETPVEKIERKILFKCRRRVRKAAEGILPVQNSGAAGGASSGRPLPC